MLLNALTSVMDNPNSNAFLLSLDFSKAFDKIPYNLMILKLIHLKFPKWFILWTADYLTNRQQYVRLPSTTSEMKAILSGVPQGSVIGPALFSIFMSDLTSQSMNCTLVKYTDDTCIAISITKGRSRIPACTKLSD